MRVLTLTLNRGKFIIPVEKEIEQAMTYIEIQKIKYGSRVGIMYDIEAGVYGYNTVDQINQRSGLDQAGYGIRNVDERIKLQFGTQYGTWIGSRFGCGTTVLVRIPLFLKKKIF